MTSSHVQPLAARKAAPLPQATLDALAVIAGTHVREQLGAMAASLGAALADVDAPGLEPRTVYQRVKSARLLKENAYAFHHLVADAFDAAVRAELAQLGPQEAVAADAGALTLVPLDEIDDKLAFAALARPFDIAHAEALATLSVRLGMLLGRGVLRADANPFRPAVFLTAIDAAWRAFEPDELAHGLLRPLLVPEIVFDFTPLLDALAAELRKDSRAGRAGNYHIQKTAEANAARADNKAVLAERLRKLFGDGEGDGELPLIPVLADMPSGSGGWRPSTAAGFHVPAAAADGAGIAANGFMAPAPDGAAAHGSAGPGSAGHGSSVHGSGGHGSGGHGSGGHGAAAHGALAGTSSAAAPAFAASMGGAGPAGGAFAPGAAGGAPLGELLARLEAFVPSAPVPGAAPENVFYLPRLKQSLPQGSLGRADERTIDLLSRVFETVLLDDGMPAQARDLLRLLQVPVLKAALLDRNFFFEDAHPARRLVDLLSHMGWEQRTEADDPVFQAMQRGVAAVDAAARTRQDAPGAAAAFSAAVAELEAQIEAGREADERALDNAIAGPVASALAQEKLDTAIRAARDAIALRIGGGDVADVVGSFLEQRWTTVLTFAYSIEDTRPGAVDNATLAMDDLIWSVRPKATQEQRKTLIARLPRLLSALNKWLDAIKWQDAERLQFFAGLAECHAAIVRAPIELSPERQLELAVEAAQQDALRRVELEQAAVERDVEREAARAEAWSPLEGLERGVWLEFRTTDGPRKAKLAWASPLRTLFIFSGADRREAFSLSADKLAAALHAGRARVLAIDGVVGQVLSDAMRESAVNDELPLLAGAAV
jgi:hypothetical protein